MTEHPSQFALEACAVGEVDSSVDAHVRDCSVCQGYVRELLDERSAFECATCIVLDTAPIRVVRGGSSPPGRPWWLNLRLWLPTVAACVLLVMWIRPALDTHRATPPSSPDSSAPSHAMTELADNVRIKGQSLRVEINRLRGPKAEQFFSDLTIRKGDRLQFAVWVDRASTLDIVLIDEATQTHIT